MLDFSQVRTVNLDEYCGLKADDPQSYRYFMDTHLFDRVNINKENTFLPAAPPRIWRRRPSGTRSWSGLWAGRTCSFWASGHNGHIGFNEPADHFPAAVHQVQLTESTIRANSRLFDKIEDVPTTAITMGIGLIMLARKILLIAGADKRAIVEEAFYGKITPPGARLHPAAPPGRDGDSGQRVRPQREKRERPCP